MSEPGRGPAPQANADGELWAIVPVKPLLESKSAWRICFCAEERADLVRELMRHVLAAMQQVPEIGRTPVISSDPLVWDVARRDGCHHSRRRRRRI